MKVLIGSAIVAAILIMSACISYAPRPYHEPECPVCEGCSEGEEDPYLCSKYYADKEAPVIDTQTGAHDFYLEGEDKITSSKLATKCQACGIYFTYPDYEEHIKTCYP